MIIFCDLSPVVVTEISTEKKEKNEIIGHEKKYATGEGVDMAIFSKSIAQRHKLLLYASNDQILNNILEDMGVSLSSVEIKDSNKNKYILKDENINVITNNPRITMEDKNEILSRFSQLCQDGNLAVLSDRENEEIYKLIRIAKNNSQKIILITDSPSKYLNDPPNMMILDKDKLGENIKYFSDIRKKSEKLFKNGLEILMVMGSRIAIFTKTEELVINSEKKIEGLDKNKIAVGFASAIERKYDLRISSKFALACGISKDGKDIKENMNYFRLEKI